MRNWKQITSKWNEMENQPGGCREIGEGLMKGRAKESIGGAKWGH